MAETLITEELHRRKILSKAIDAIIARDFFHPQPPLRRGQVQNLILKELALVQSNEIRTLINERMQAIGWKLKILDGNFIYR